MRAAFRALVAGSLAAGFVALAVADAEAAVNAKVRRACASDYKRLCPAYKVGSNQLRACMESKSSEISSNCIDALIDAGEVDRRRARR
jgi:hypothetical protein